MLDQRMDNGNNPENDVLDEKETQMKQEQLPTEQRSRYHRQREQAENETS